MSEDEQAWRERLAQIACVAYFQSQDETISDDLVAFACDGIIGRSPCWGVIAARVEDVVMERVGAALAAESREQRQRAEALWRPYGVSSWAVLAEGRAQGAEAVAQVLGLSLGPEA